MTSSAVRDDIVEQIRSMRTMLSDRGLAHVSLFGSAARGDESPDSDIDLLVELSEPMGFSFFTLQEDLSEILGRRVDLLTRDGMRPRVLAEAEADLVPIF